MKRIKSNKKSIERVIVFTVFFFYSSIRVKRRVSVLTKFRFPSGFFFRSSSGVPDARISSISSSSPDDFDVLEDSEREKVVNKLWSVYCHGYGGVRSKIRLPKFWEQAFQAAYESLVSDAPAVQEDAVFEIAKMSLFSKDLLPPPTQSLVLKQVVVAVILWNQHLVTVAIEQSVIPSFVYDLITSKVFQELVLALLLKLEKRIADVQIDSSELGFTKPCPYIYELLGDLNVKTKTANKLMGIIGEAVLILEEGENGIGSKQPQEVKGSSCKLNSIGDILRIIFRDGGSSHAHYYRAKCLGR